MVNQEKNGKKLLKILVSLKMNLNQKMEKTEEMLITEQKNFIRNYKKKKLKTY